MVRFWPPPHRGHCPARRAAVIPKAKLPASPARLRAAGPVARAARLRAVREPSAASRPARWWRLPGKQSWFPGSDRPPPFPAPAWPAPTQPWRAFLARRPPRPGPAVLIPAVLIPAVLIPAVPGRPAGRPARLARPAPVRARPTARGPARVPGRPAPPGNQRAGRPRSRRYAPNWLRKRCHLRPASRGSPAPSRRGGPDATGDSSLRHLGSDPAPLHPPFRHPGPGIRNLCSYHPGSASPITPCSARSSHGRRRRARPLPASSARLRGGGPGDQSRHLTVRCR